MRTTRQTLSPAPPRARQRWVLALTSVASLMVGLDILVVTTALTTIRLRLGASIEELEWIVNAYTLSFAVLLMTASALGDRFGRRRLFLTGLGLFTVMSAACALAPSIGWLIVARAVQGAGSAMIMPHALALLSAAYPPHRRARALGIFSGVTGLAILGGPMIGGAVVQGLAWPWIFWLNVPIGLAVIPLAARKIGESRGSAARLDYGGVVLVTGTALGLVWGLVRGNTVGWGSPEVTGALGGGVVLLAAFVAWEQRARAPMLPMRLFRSRAFAAGNAAGFGMFASIFGTVFFLAQFLQATWHYGPLGAGLRLAPWTITLSLVAPVAGAWAGKIGERPLIAGGLALQAAGSPGSRWPSGPGSGTPRWSRRSCWPGAGRRWPCPPRRAAWSARSRPPTSARRLAPSTRCASSAARSVSRSWPRCSPGLAATPPRARSAPDSCPWPSSRPACRWRARSPARSSRDGRPWSPRDPRPPRKPIRTGSSGRHEPAGMNPAGMNPAGMNPAGMNPDT